MLQIHSKIKVGPHHYPMTTNHQPKQPTLTVYCLEIDKYSFEHQYDGNDATSSQKAAAALAAPVENTMNHVHVNAIADYYDIKALTELAIEKIQAAYGKDWDKQSFLDATEEALAKTGDGSLHEMMAFLAATHIKELLDDDRFDILIDGFGGRVLRNRVQQFEPSEEQLRQIITSVKGAFKNSEAQVNTAENRARIITENVQRCHDVLADHSICRNGSCTAEFNCYIEKRGTLNLPIYTLRCTKCQCRHG